MTAMRRMLKAMRRMAAAARATCSQLHPGTGAELGKLRVRRAACAVSSQRCRGACRLRGRVALGAVALPARGQLAEGIDGFSKALVQLEDLLKGRLAALEA